jgi:hypothetical protein
MSALQAQELSAVRRVCLSACVSCRFKEEVAVLERMMGIGDIVRRAGLPTFICLQVG